MEQLKLINPDIVCLQETHINSERSIATEIGKKIGGYFLEEFDVSPSHIDKKFHLGNAILSKQKPTKEGHFLFPYPTFPLYLPGNKLAEHHDKGFQVVQFSFTRVINLQMMPLRFLGTPYGSPQGEKFAHKMEDLLKLHAERPILVCGDFNTDDTESLYRPFLESAGMKSALLPDMPTRPNKKRSDYIFYSDNFILRDSGVIQTNTDHYLCWARLEI